MKALPTGVTTGIVLSADKTTVKIAAIYSPGVTTPSGNAEQWIFWEITRSMASDETVRLWTAVAHRRLECGLVLPLSLERLDGHCQVVTQHLSDLLVCLGLGASVRSPKMLGATAVFVEQVDSQMSPFALTDLPHMAWYFSPESADAAKVAGATA